MSERDRTESADWLTLMQLSHAQVSGPEGRGFRRGRARPGPAGPGAGVRPSLGVRPDAAVPGAAATPRHLACLAAAAARRPAWFGPARCSFKQ